MNLPRNVYLSPRHLLHDFEKFFGPLNSSKEGNFFAGFETDIHENEKSYFVKSYLPGIKKENIHISIDDGILHIEAHQDNKNNEEKENYILKERTHHNFKRSFSLNDHVDENNIVASYNDGVLTLELHKAQKESKKIVVN